MATRGRPPRKTKFRPKGGKIVKVKPHRRTPRGSNKGKPKVTVKPYRRNVPAGRTRSRKR